MHLRDETGRERVLSLYASSPMSDTAMATALGMKRSTVSKFRNEAHLAAVSTCTVCGTVVSTKRTLCREHAKNPDRVQTAAEFRADQAKGRALIELAVASPQRYKADFDALRLKIGARKFQARFGWVERAVMRDRKTRSEAKAAVPRRKKITASVENPSEGQETPPEVLDEPQEPQPQAPRPTASSIFGDEPEMERPVHHKDPAKRVVKDKWSEPYTGPAKALDTSPPRAYDEDADFEQHRAGCDDPECGCKDPKVLAQRAAARGPPARPVQPPAPTQAAAPQAPQQQGAQNEDSIPGFFLLRHRRHPQPASTEK